MADYVWSILSPVFSTRPKYAKLRLHLKGMKNAVRCLAVSPDSSTIAAATIQGGVRTWNILDGSGLTLKQPETHVVGSYGIAFSPNGQFLAAAVKTTVYLWIVKTGQPNFEFSHPGDVNSIAFSPDSMCLACGLQDIHIWCVETKQQVHLFKGHTGDVQGLSYFSCGTHLVSSSYDSTIRIWDLEQGGKVQTTWKGHGSTSANCCALSPGGDRLASGGLDNQVIIWDVKTGEWTGRPYQGHCHFLRSVSFSPDGKHLASASDGNDGEIHIQDSQSGSYLAKVNRSDRLVVYTPDGRYIVTRDKKDTKLVRVLELTTPALPLPQPVPRIAGPSEGTQSISSTASDSHPVSAKDAPRVEKSLPPPYE